MGLLYGRAGRLTAQNGGFRPGQRSLSKLSDAVRTESAAYAATVGRASRQDLDRFTLSLSSCVSVITHTSYRETQ